jgi:hypothetical protein
VDRERLDAQREELAKGFKATRRRRRSSTSCVGKLSFDPLAFTSEKPKDQAETLRKLVGLDFTLNDRARQRLYDERTGVNREIAALKAVSNVPPVDAPDEPVDVAALLAEQDKAHAQQRAKENLARAVHTKRGELDHTERVVTATKTQIEALERQLAEARAQLGRAEQAAIEMREAVRIAQIEAEVAPVTDIEGIRKRLAEAEGVNARVRAKKARAAEAAKLVEKEAEAKKLSDQISILDLQKANAVADAHFPIQGLGFADEGVTLNGLPLEQASSAEQLRVSLAVGIALNPKLKVLLIRDGSLLDENSMRLVAVMAESAGAQVWVEVVGKEGGIPGVVIEDGAVEGAPLVAVNGEAHP